MSPTPRYVRSGIPGPDDVALSPEEFTRLFKRKSLQATRKAARAGKLKAAKVGGRWVIYVPRMIKEAQERGRWEPIPVDEINQ